jgi:hypothetical protein
MKFNLRLLAVIFKFVVTNSVEIIFFFEELTGYQVLTGSLCMENGALYRVHKSSSPVSLLNKIKSIYKLQFKFVII